MDKREFLKASGGFVAASMISGAFAQQHPEPRTNWAGNYTFSTENLHMPASVDEVREVVKKCSHVRALGTRHSFNSIADSKENQVSLKKLDQITLDEKARTVTVGAGVRYGDLATVIDKRGYAVHNLASLPHISVAGACSTATHGSGVHNGNLATAVAGLEIVTADGAVAHLTREKGDPRFAAWPVGLGALGVVTSVTLEVQPTFQVAQSVYQNLSFDHLQHHFEEIFSAAYSVSLFTDWQNHQATQVWIKRRLAPGDANKWQPEFFGAKLATEKLHPLAGHSAEACTEQQGIPGPWYERLPHFRMNFTPSSGQELQSEYLRPPRPRIRSHPRRRKAARPHHASPLHHRAAHHRRRQAVDEHGLRAPLPRHPLHVEAGVARSPPGAAADRSRARALRAAPALGQAVHPRPRQAAVALHKARRIQGTRKALRPVRQVPQ